jgi:lysozyme family protein
MDLETAITGIVQREGATFTDDAQDAPTKFGITLAALKDFAIAHGSSPAGITVAVLQAFTEAEARIFYRWRFEAFLGLQVDARVWVNLLDAVTLHGPTGAVKAIQAAAGVTVDGHLGPKTAAAVRAMPPAAFCLAFVDARTSICVDDVRRDIASRYGQDALDQTDLKYLRGWIRRIIHVGFAALALAAIASLQACTGALAGGTVSSLKAADPLPVLTDGTSLAVEVDPARGGAMPYLAIYDGGAAHASGNVVDNGDQTGRQIQASLYNGHWDADSWPCNDASQIWGWNPVQEGNACQATSGGRVESSTATSIVTSTTPRQWNSRLGTSKVDLRQTLTIVAPGVLRIDDQVTNHEAFTIGADNWHELPVAYLSPAFEFGSYVDLDGALQHTATSHLVFGTGAPWVALSTVAGWTVALYAPGDHPWSIGFGGGDKPASFLQAWQWLELAPEQTGVATTWLVVGRTLDQVRERIAALEASSR